jgi:hypothetical protein
MANRPHLVAHAPNGWGASVAGPFARIAHERDVQATPSRSSRSSRGSPSSARTRPSRSPCSRRA